MPSICHQLLNTCIYSYIHTYIHTRMHAYTVWRETLAGGKHWWTDYFRVFGERKFGKFNRLLIISTNLDGFSLANHGRTIHQIRQHFPPLPPPKYPPYSLLDCMFTVCYVWSMGPLTASWCMRLETKNSYFKGIIDNVPFFQFSFVLCTSLLLFYKVESYPCTYSRLYSFYCECVVVII